MIHLSYGTNVHPAQDLPGVLTQLARYAGDCATVLAALLPAEAGYGSISTLPLGWRHPWNEATAATALDALVALLRTLPRPIRLAVEPEPGCVLDTVDDAVRWLTDRADPQYVGLCLDTCHLAVSFADPRAARRRPGRRDSPARAGRIHRTPLPAPGPGAAARRCGARRRRPAGPGATRARPLAGALPRTAALGTLPRRAGQLHP